MSHEYHVISNDEVVGTMTVLTDGDEIVVAHRVHNNGRGARVDERITLGGQGAPSRWTIAGVSMMGGSVDESFELDGTTARWRSQAEEGEAEAVAPSVYLPADGTPFSAGLLLDLALRNGGSVPTLPSGTAVAELLERIEGTDVDLYALNGVALEPLYLLRTAGGGFAGMFQQDGLTVLPDLVEHRPAITRARERQVARRLGAISSAVAPAPARVLIVRDVHVLDIDAGSFGEPCDVRIEDGIITAIGHVPDEPGSTVVLGEGRYLIPGLHDLHAHLSGPDALLYVAAGVTTVRDMGNTHERLTGLTERISAGELIGPSVVAAGFIEGRSEHSMRLGKVVGTLEEALEAVAWYDEAGYRRIKLYNSFDPAWLRPVADEAHRRGMTIFGHVPAFSSPDEVIAAGFDEITHLNQLVLGWVLEDGEDTRTPLRATALARAADLDLDSERVQRTIDAMVDRGIGIDTTAVIIERLLLSRAGKTLPADEPFLSHMPVAYQRYRRRTYLPYRDEAELVDYERAFKRLLDIIRLLHERGVPLWPGTDDGTGFTVHRELELYVEAGLTPIQALRRGTVDSAAHLDRAATHGRIGTGFAADLVLLEGDPLRDIGEIRRSALTILGGRPIAPAAIHARFGIQPFAGSPTVSAR